MQSLRSDEPPPTHTVKFAAIAAQPPPSSNAGQTRMRQQRSIASENISKQTLAIELDINITYMIVIMNGLQL
jgi:hypothetical protein